MKVLIAAATLLATAVSSAQTFTVLREEPQLSGVAGPRPVAGSLYGLDHAELSTMLSAAPREQPALALTTYGLHVRLPLPDGSLEECVVAESPLMETALAERYRGIRTYLVQSAAHPECSGRCEVSARGLTAMLRWDGAVWMIDPWQSADNSHLVSYWLRDLPGGGDWVCHTAEGVHGFSTPEGSGFSSRSVTTLRQYRLMMACTGEYGLYQSQIQGHDPNIADPLAAIVTVVSRANVVYEADLSVRLILVANNDQVIFVDPNTDPYASTCGGGGGTDCSGSHLGVNQTVADTRIGAANYDIGHVLTRIYGGVAYLSCVCTGNKAGGVSGIPRGGDIDPFTALVAIHEMGHQFGANHTFSGTRGRCQGNVNLATAWEAGSGSSPMAYAGGCPVGDAAPTDNIQLFADPFFHHGSLGEMQTFLNGSGGQCAQAIETANNLPVIDTPATTVHVPPSTPFTLALSAHDPDGEPLTYSWEEYDSGVARPLIGTGSEDSGQGALFRAFPPVRVPLRTFPTMADVLSAHATPGEQMPTVTGVSRRFRAAVRDNHPGSGGTVVSPFVTVNIPANLSVFRVTSPVSGDTRRAGVTTIQWTVGGTDQAPTSCALVSILLSVDDGATFSVLVAGVANTGSATVTIPEVTTQAARVRVQGDGQVFFALSRPFAVVRSCDAVDINHDGVVDLFDYLDFVEDLSSGSAAGDFNQDGSLDLFDYLDFVWAFSAGC